MEQLTNEETARIFSMYYGCPIDAGLITAADGYWISKIASGTTDTVLLLTPLSKIADEHAIGIAKIYYGSVSNGMSAERLNLFGRRLIQNIASTIDKIHAIQIFLAIQQLILWHYAVPLYFGINHPCNGKTAIELGIAIDKTLI